MDIVGTQGTREIDIDQFYLGYKKLALQPDELIRGVRFSVPRAAERLGLYKISRRHDLDISTFTAAVLLRLDDGVIAERPLVALHTVPQGNLWQWVTDYVRLLIQ